MSQNVIQEFSHVHDNQITSYSVDIQNEVLTMETKYGETEKTKITFTGWLAHSFDYVIYSNIIFDITQVTIDYYVKTYQAYLEQSLRRCFPAYFDNVEALRLYLTQEHYNIYEISSSLGLSGTVFAKDIQIDVTAI